MTNMSSVAPAYHERRRQGEPALTKRFCGFDSWLVLGHEFIPKTLKMGVIPACIVFMMK